MLLLGLPALAGGGCLGMVISWFVAMILDITDTGSPSMVAPVMFGLPALFAVAMGGAWLYSLLSVLRTAAWLDGTRLTVQRVRPRTVDLATANSVGLRPTRHRFRFQPPGVTRANDERIPELVVIGPEGTVRLPLLMDTGSLPPRAHLIALAAVLSTAQRPGSAEVAQELYNLSNRAPWQ